MIKKVNTILLLWTIVSIILIVNIVSAERLYQVGTDQLNVRSSPSHSANVVGQLSQGDHLKVFEEKFGWMQTYYKGEKAWVASQYLIKSDNEYAIRNSTVKEEVTITAEDVRLRSGPGLNYHIISYTNSGESFELVDSDRDWLKIVQADGSTAWVAGWLTSHSEASSQSTVKHLKATNTDGQLNGINIVLDPGHGGQDPGSISLSNKFEKDYTLTTTKIIADKLRQSGADVILTRTDDTSISLDNRINISHSYDTDAYISVHYDAFETNNIHGVSTHYYGSSESLNLAQIIQEELSTYTGLNNRGIMNSPFHVLKNNKHLAVLIELGFLTNEHDLVSIEAEEHAHLVAEAINHALIQYYN